MLLSYQNSYMDVVLADVFMWWAMTDARHDSISNAYHSTIACLYKTSLFTTLCTCYPYCCQHLRSCGDMRSLLGRTYVPNWSPLRSCCHKLSPKVHVQYTLHVNIQWLQPHTLCPCACSTESGQLPV